MSYACVAGSPCWLDIPAIDVSRAKAFYGTVFNWSFEPHPSGLSEDEFTIFKFPDAKFPLFGGIKKYDPANLTTGGGIGVVKLFLFVENDLEGKMDEIVRNGGKKVTEMQPEGDHGFVMDFDDTEGNRFGIYMHKKASS